MQIRRISSLASDTHTHKWVIVRTIFHHESHSRMNKLLSHVFFFIIDCYFAWFALAIFFARKCSQTKQLCLKVRRAVARVRKEGRASFTRCLCVRGRLNSQVAVRDSGLSQWHEHRRAPLDKYALPGGSLWALTTSSDLVAGDFDIS